MGAVQDMIRALSERGIVAEWVSTGGGCYAVAVNFGDQYRYGNEFFNPFEILITTQEGPLEHDDMNRDDAIPGFYAALYVYDERWERVTDEGFTLYQSESGLISPREHADMLADGVFMSEIPSTPVFADEVSALVERVAWYAFKVAFAHRDGRTVAESTDFPSPEVVRVKRTNGIAGQFQMTAWVQYGETSPDPCHFVGSTYGGPVVMVDFHGVQHMVSNPHRFGDFGKNPTEWVHGYFERLN